ncbi:MAG TPA: sensor protein KdpD [Ignavibacteria bacterium]|nr:sensor protein KdpD [Ignavibacteria bacterium]
MLESKFNKTESVDNFLELLKKSKEGKLKIYIGMAAGVGKTYKMLLDTNALINNGVDVAVGYIETHGRPETERLLKGIPLLARKKVYYKGKEFEEMNLDAILQRQPEVVVVDELAHTNAPGSKNAKRYQDVLDIINSGISVITAVNIQHIESLNSIIEEFTGVKVSETVPDNFINLADEVVNIDITVDELIDRLEAGKIYKRDKIVTALNNFFKKDNLLQLRELSLREVANKVERKIESQVPKNEKRSFERILVCIGTNYKLNEKLLRQSYRFAERLDCAWYVLFVETNKNSFETVDLETQRYLINNFELATKLGADSSERIKSEQIAEAIMDFAKQNDITKIIIGKPRNKSFFKKIGEEDILKELVNNLENSNWDLEIVA